MVRLREDISDLRPARMVRCRDCETGTHPDIEFHALPLNLHLADLFRRVKVSNLKGSGVLMTFVWPSVFELNNVVWSYHVPESQHLM